MNKKTIIIDIILAIVIFFGAQVVSSVICTVVNFSINAPSGDISPDKLVKESLGWIMTLSSLICILLFILLKHFHIRYSLKFKGCSWRFVPIVTIASVLGILGLDITQEYLNLPNLLEKDMLSMCNKTEGIIAIAVLGPITEELVFRGVICGTLLRNGAGVWTSILVSAFIFGLIHINPAQVPFAMAIGVILAILYYKTGSLIPSILLHIANNSVAVVIMNAYSDQPDIMFRDLWGDAVSVSIIVIGLTVSTLLFIRYWKTKQ